MSLHAELLKQAHFLAGKEPEKPIQTSLRRSFSASYYVLFHLLVDDATRLMLAGNVRRPLRDSLARAFRPSAMKQTALPAFTRKKPRPLERPGRVGVESGCGVRRVSLYSC